MLIRDIHYYLDTAKENKDYSSDRKLGQALDYSHGQVCNLRKQTSFPSDASMIAIAEMAGVNQEIALLDLAMWRTRGIAQNTYASILQKISHLTLIIFTTIAVIGSSASLSPAYAMVNNSLNMSSGLSATVCYGNYYVYHNIDPTQLYI